jgi:hypothetical protein
MAVMTAIASSPHSTTSTGIGTGSVNVHRGPGGRGSVLPAQCWRCHVAVKGGDTLAWGAPGRLVGTVVTCRRPEALRMLEPVVAAMNAKARR